MPGLSGVSTLVTGGAGFIGSHLVEELIAEGADVTVLDNLRDGSADNLRTVPGARLLVADVRSLEQVARAVAESNPSVIFHLAANASVPGSVSNPAYDFEANSAGTFILLDALRRAGGCNRVVLASSGAIYGQPSEFPIRESTLSRPISPYGASKVNAEVTARMFWDVYRLPVTTARLFNCYGPRMARFVILDFMRKLTRDPDELEILGNGRQVRDFTYVADTVQGLRLLAALGEPGETYNLSSGVSTSVTDLAHQLIGVMGLTGRTRLRYTGASWVGDAQRWEVCIDRIAALGYRPSIPLFEGLVRTVNWYILGAADCGTDCSDPYTGLNC